MYTTVFHFHFVLIVFESIWSTQILHVKFLKKRVTQNEFSLRVEIKFQSFNEQLF